MKNIIFILLIVLAVSCKKDNPKPSYVPKYATVKIVVTAEDLAHANSFQTSIDYYILKTNISGSAVSSTSKSTTITTEIPNVQDDKEVTVQAHFLNAADCTVPITIQIYYNNALLGEKTITNICSDSDGVVGFGVSLPAH